MTFMFLRNFKDVQGILKAVQMRLKHIYILLHAVLDLNIVIRV